MTSKLAGIELNPCRSCRVGRGPVVSAPTDWTLVDRQMGIARSKLETARTEVEYQSVGLVCRETLLTLAKEVFDAQRHSSLDGKIGFPLISKE